MTGMFGNFGLHDGGMYSVGFYYKDAMALYNDKVRSSTVAVKAWKSKYNSKVRSCNVNVASWTSKYNTKVRAYNSLLS